MVYVAFGGICTVALANSQKQPPSLTYRLPGSPTTLDWTHAQTPEEGDVLYNVMEGLIDLDESLQPQPRLAQSWTVSPDHRTYTFTLRAGVQWSDGKPLTSAHFVTSWQRLAQSQSGYNAYLADVASLETPNAKTLVVKLKRTVPYFLELLSFWVTFPLRDDMVAGKAWLMPQTMPVLGAYKIKSYNPGKLIELQRNEKYWDKPPSVGQVNLLVETDEHKARSLFDNKKIDILLDATQLDLLRFGASATSGDNDTNLFRKFKYFGVYYLGFNHRDGIGKQLEFRRAMAAAIDINKLVRDLGVGGQAATSFIPPGLMGYSTNSYIEFSTTKAKEDLAKVKANNNPKELAQGAAPLVMVVRKGPRAELAKNVSAQLQSNLGISIVVRELDSADYVSEMLAGHYDLAIAGWGADYPDPATFMDVMLSSGNLSRTAWNNAGYDSLVKNAGDTVNRAERAEYYRVAQKILLQDEQAIVPLYYAQTSALVSSRVGALYIGPVRAMQFRRVNLK